MSNENPQPTNIATVGEAQKTQVGCKDCTQIIVEKLTINPGQDVTTSSASQNQSFMRRIANQIRYKIKGTTILKQMLQKFYKGVTLPCVTWLDQGQDLIMSNYYTDLKLDSSETPITITEIFDKTDEKELKRILIEGQPGYGKTTLATKLIYDWAIHEKYIKHFKLAFLIPLRELRKRSIEQAMTNIANLCGFNNNSCFRNILQKNISNILLIVDGLDELAVIDRMPILKLLYKQKYAQITVIVTCRTGSFTPDRDELSELFGGISKKKVFYDKRAEVLGIAIENTKNFLLKFIPNENAEHIITEIEKLTDPVKEMFKSPLFLILLAYIASNESDLTALSTKTDLFKRLFNCIINRSLKTQECNEYDLFNFDSTLNETQNTIQQYGKRALDQLVNDKMQFECDELTKQIYQLGFLINNKQISGLHSTSHYEAFHRSILEFAAAFSLWINFKQNPSTNAFHHIQSVYPQLDKTSLVVPFLIGLLQDEACHFFNQFTSHAHFFSANNERLWRVLAECPTNSMWDKLLPSIIPFLPAVINHRLQPVINMQLPDFYENLIQVGIENNRIERIVVSDAESISRLPKNVIIPQLLVRFKGCNQMLINSLQGIQCKNIICYQNRWCCDINFLKLFSLVIAQSYSLVLQNNGDLIEIMYEHIDDDVVKQLQLNHLYFHVWRSPKSLPLIQILLKRNQVQHLHIRHFEISSDYHKIISAATISSYLHSFDFPSNNELVLVIDLFDLTQGGKKKYNHLQLTNCQIVSKCEIQDKNCIHSLIIDYDEQFKLRQSSDGLSTFEPKVFRCNLSVIQQLSQSWMGYTSLKELDLFLEENSFENIENLSFLSNCKNIKKLTIEFDNIYIYSLDKMNKFIEYVQQLPIDQLEIFSCTPDSDWEKLCKHIASSLPWMNKSHPILTLKLIFSGIDDDEDENICSVILDFLECLKLGYLKTINLSYDQYLNWDSLMKSNIIDYSLFRITHSLTYDKNSTFEHKFCINLKE